MSLGENSRRRAHDSIAHSDSGKERRRAHSSVSKASRAAIGGLFPSLIAQIGLSQCFWHHFAYTVNWYEGLDRGAPQPRGPPAVYSLRTALLQYTTGYGSGLLTSTPACSGDGLTAPWPAGGTCLYIHKYWKTFTHCESLPYISGHFDGNVLTHGDI